MLFKMIPLISIANVSGAIQLAMSCGYLAWLPQGSNQSRASTKEKILIAIITLIIVVLFKQMASRPTIETGSNWGHVDFETLAYYLAVLIGMISLFIELRKQEFYSLAKIVKQTILIFTKAMLPIMLLYFLFKFFVEGTSLFKRKFPNEQFTIFYFNYTHPERILLALFIIFSSIFCVLIVKNYALYKRIS